MKRSKLVKLVLAKETIIRLNNAEMTQVRGEGTSGNMMCTEAWTCQAYTGCTGPEPTAEVTCQTWTVGTSAAR